MQYMMNKTSKWWQKKATTDRNVIAGPCVWEGFDHAEECVLSLLEIAEKYEVNFIYKTSFDKANRTSSESYRGQGFDSALMGFADLCAKYPDLEIITDVHESWQAEVMADTVHVLQIPAFLCRQTDLIKTAILTGLPVNIKKGQFLSPYDARHIVDKAKSIDPNAKIMLTERGTSFGYNNLVVDMTGLEVMKDYDVPICFDCTHSVQRPGGSGASSGGDRRFAPVLARAAYAVGIDCLFAEVHQDPDNAPSDGPNMLTFEMYDEMLERLYEGG